MQYTKSSIEIHQWPASELCNLNKSKMGLLWKVITITSYSAFYLWKFRLFLRLRYNNWCFNGQWNFFDPSRSELIQSYAKFKTCLGRQTDVSGIVGDHVLVVVDSRIGYLSLIVDDGYFEDPHLQDARVDAMLVGERLTGSVLIDICQWSEEAKVVSRRVSPFAHK